MLLWDPKLLLNDNLYDTDIKETQKGFAVHKDFYREARLKFKSLTASSKLSYYNE